NGTYQGTITNNVSGWRTSVWIQNNGNWSGWYATSYSKGTWSYSYSDGNSNSLIHLCVDNQSGVWRCGWGTQWASGWTSPGPQTLIQQTHFPIRGLRTMRGRSMPCAGCGGKSGSSRTGGTIRPRSSQLYRPVEE